MEMQRQDVAHQIARANEGVLEPERRRNRALIASAMAQANIERQMSIENLLKTIELLQATGQHKAVTEEMLHDVVKMQGYDL